MMFGGSARRALRDNRTEEEMLRDAQAWMNSNGMPGTQAAPPLSSPPGLTGMFGRSALPALQDKTAASPAPMFTPSDGAVRAAALSGGQPAAQPPAQDPALDGAWSNFDPSLMADRPMPSRMQAAAAAINGAPTGGPAKPQRRPWEMSRSEKWGNALSMISQSLLAAQAAQDGNFSGYASMTQNMQENALRHRRRLDLARALSSQGYTDDQVMIALSDPESVGRNYNERFGTRVVSPNSSIVTGAPGGQQAAYTQPGQAEAYAAAMGFKPGTPAYQTAMQDYTLRGNGPSAYGYDIGLDDRRTENDTSLERARQAGRTALEAQRQTGRLGLEGERQRNRMTTRGTPTYRDLNPPAPRTGGAPARSASTGPTATGPNGQKLQWDGKAWVPVR